MFWFLLSVFVLSLVVGIGSAIEESKEPKMPENSQFDENKEKLERWSRGGWTRREWRDGLPHINPDTGKPWYKD